jgi:hypothetical protein
MITVRPSVSPSPRRITFTELVCTYVVYSNGPRMFTFPPPERSLQFISKAAAVAPLSRPTGVLYRSTTLIRAHLHFYVYIMCTIFAQPPYEHTMLGRARYFYPHVRDLAATAVALSRPQRRRRTFTPVSYSTTCARAHDDIYVLYVRRRLRDKAVLHWHHVNFPSTASPSRPPRDRVSTRPSHSCPRRTLIHTSTYIHKRVQRILFSSSSRSPLFFFSTVQRRSTTVAYTFRVVHPRIIS